jgi:hypothetical protein
MKKVLSLMLAVMLIAGIVSPVCADELRGKV